MRGGKLYFCCPFWRLVRVVEGARLESVYTGNRIEGSNPSVSAFFYTYFELEAMKCLLSSINSSIFPLKIQVALKFFFTDQSQTL
jgi:hypothetical protein